MRKGEEHFTAAPAAALLQREIESRGQSFQLTTDAPFNSYFLMAFASDAFCVTQRVDLYIHKYCGKMRFFAIVKQKFQQGSDLIIYPR